MTTPSQFLKLGRPADAIYVPLLVLYYTGWSSPRRGGGGGGGGGLHRNWDWGERSMRLLSNF